jgi:hypothetical protein
MRVLARFCACFAWQKAFTAASLGAGVRCQEGEDQARVGRGQRSAGSR